MKKEVLIVLDSVGYERFMKAQISNFKSLGEVHKAYAHGSWTLPSMAAMFAGYLPTCSIENCFHNSLLSGYSPFFLEHLTRTRYVYVYSANGWIWKLMLSVNVPGYFPRTYDYNECAHEIVEDLTAKKEPFFALMLLTETHQPYTTEKGQKFETYDDLEELKRRQTHALEHLDKVLEPILKDSTYNVIVTADHGENFEKGYYGHQLKVFRPKLLEVPLVSRWKN